MKKNRKKYDSAFKLEAIRLAVEERHNISEAERNLGVSKGTLARWVRENKSDPENAFPGKGHLKAKDEELRKLKLNLKRTQEERDILKKALAYFGDAVGTSMLLCVSFFNQLKVIFSCDFFTPS